MFDISIRPLTSMANIKPIEKIQMQAWGRDPIQVTPAHVLKAAQYNGALLLGAFDGETLVGYAYAILGVFPPRKDTQPFHVADHLQLYSHQVAVLPAYQSHGIGRQLKFAQRTYALQMGLHLITWTFDPILSRNAWLNIGRLGGITNTYMPDYYGKLDAAMSDRFHLEWWIDSKRVKQHIAGRHTPARYAAVIDEGAVVVNPAEWGDDGLIRPAAELKPAAGDKALIEIPADFPALVERDYDLGLAWREQTRASFLRLLAEGFIVADFVRHEEVSGRKRSFYYLSRQDAGRILMNI